MPESPLERFHDSIRTEFHYTMSHVRRIGADKPIALAGFKAGDLVPGKIGLMWRFANGFPFTLSMSRRCSDVCS